MTPLTVGESDRIAVALTGVSVRRLRAAGVIYEPSDDRARCLLADVVDVYARRDLGALRALRDRETDPQLAHGLMLVESMLAGLVIEEAWR